jgi:acetyltransferase-like isoleucine patch superfamily enzyme
MLRGRDQFANAEPILNLGVKVVGHLPHFIRRPLLQTTRNIPGKLGLGIRYLIVQVDAASCGRVVAVFESVFLKNLERISLGNNVSIHPMCYLEGEGRLSIGSDVSIAHGVTIMTTEHDYDVSQGKMRDSPVKRAPVLIGDDVWIGAGVKILAGVSIGDHVVIGAGAVVTKDIPSDSVAVGVPARVIKRLDSKT